MSEAINKMSLKEKINRQRAIIDEIFDVVGSELINSYNDPGNFIKPKLIELFHIEMDYYGISYEGNDKEASIDFFHKKNGGCGFFEYKTHDKPHTVKINDAKSFEELVDSSTYTRLWAARDILSTLFHEIGHLLQAIPIFDGICSYYNLRNVKEQILRNYVEDFYLFEHDRYSSEADADHHTYNTLVQDGIKLPGYKAAVRVFDADREISYLLTKKGIVDRDKYDEELADKYIESKPTIILLFGCDVLLYEFTRRCEKKEFKILIDEYIAYIKKLSENSELNLQDKKELIKDAKSLYFHLFNKRIKNIDEPELGEAINTYGEKFILDLLNELYIYDRNEKNRKNRLVKDGLEAFNNLSYATYDHFETNEGYIANPAKQYKGAIGTDFFVRSELNPDNYGEVISTFLDSETFREKLPVFGYYVTKSGMKMSIKSFINDILIPEFMKIDLNIDITDHDKQSMLSDTYYRLLYEKFLNSHEVAANFAYEQINKDYQAQINSISKCREMISNKTYTFIQRNDESTSLI